MYMSLILTTCSRLPTWFTFDLRISTIPCRTRALNVSVNDAAFSVDTANRYFQTWISAYFIRAALFARLAITIGDTTVANTFCSRITLPAIRTHTRWYMVCYLTNGILSTRKVIRTCTRIFAFAIYAATICRAIFIVSASDRA